MAQAIRTEQLTVRIDPRTKYLGQLAAQANRISISTQVDQAMKAAIAATLIYENGVATPLSDLAHELWADHPADRLAKLADRAPMLLTDVQRQLWERIATEQKYWKESLDEGEWNVSSATFNFEALRQDWPTLTNSKDGE